MGKELRETRPETGFTLYPRPRHRPHMKRLRGYQWLEVGWTLENSNLCILARYHHWSFLAKGAGSAVCYCLSRFRVRQNLQYNRFPKLGRALRSLLMNTTIALRATWQTLVLFVKCRRGRSTAGRQVSGQAGRERQRRRPRSNLRSHGRKSGNLLSSLSQCLCCTNTLTMQAVGPYIRASLQW